MDLIFVCRGCRKKYIAAVDNTRIHGPLIETKCPLCKKLIVKNITAFLEDQSLIKGRIPLGTDIIFQAQALGIQLNNDNPFVRGKIKKDDLPEL